MAFIKCPDCGAVVFDSPEAMAAHKQNFCAALQAGATRRPKVEPTEEELQREASRRQYTSALSSGSMNVTEAREGSIDELKAALNALTKLELDSLRSFKSPAGQSPLVDRSLTKPLIISGLVRWATRNKCVSELMAAAKAITKKAEAQKQGKQQTYTDNLAVLNKYFPEWKAVLEGAGGHNPRKFVEHLKIIITPAQWNPTGLGDFDFRHTFVYKAHEKRLVAGPAYSYDTMLNVASGSGLHNRAVTLEQADRFWDVVYTGQWGGGWVKVNLYISDAHVLVPKLLRGEMPTLQLEAPK